MEIKITPLPKQHLAHEAWNDDSVDDVLYGGMAGAGKTRWGCEAITIDALRFPGTRYFIARKELKNLMQSCFVTLTQNVFKDLGLIRDYHWKFDGKYNVVYIRKSPKSEWSTINLLDVAYLPSDPLFDRFGSHEYTRGWMDEASEAEFRAYEVLRSRVGRYKNRELKIKSKMALTLNPSQDWPYRLYYDPWKKAGKPSDPHKPLVSARAVLDGKEVERTFVFIQASSSENSYLSSEYRMSLATMSDPVLRARLLQGDWEYANANDTLFDAQTIADLFTNKLPPSGVRYMTVDVARFGRDKIVITKWNGWEAFKIDMHSKKSVPETVDLVRTDASKWGVPREHTLVDGDGVGGGVVDLLPGVIGFSGGASPFGKVGEKETRENYENLRTQCAYHFSEIARDRKAAITEPDIEIRELIAADLQQFKRRDADKDGRLKLSKKDDMKDALGRSPDVGDTLMMRSYFDLRTRDAEFGRGDSMSIFIPDDV